jgi:hypothetical protein
MRKLKPVSELSPAYRKRIESYMKRHPGATREEARGHKPKNMTRNTLGTGISDKNQSFSFTLYAYSKKDLDQTDLNNIEDFFKKKLVEWMRSRYKKAHYDWSDWENWGRKIVREEKNLKIDFDSEFYKKYSYEINQVQVEIDDLSKIL